MRFISQIQLPFLFTLFIGASTSAAPVPEANLKYLTPDNFNSTIEQGVWLIENFSPYCGHCREFAPTWAKLVSETKAQSDPGISLAQVNCIVYGDLCEELGVEYYPQLNLYRGGSFVETFQGSREYDRLKDFIAKHAEPTGTVKNATPVKTELEVTPTVEVLRLQTSRAEVNPSGTVLPLDLSNFDEVVRQEATFVIFFAPWCGHCKKLAPTWIQLARHMQHKLTIAEVNCEDNSALCKKEGVSGYPTLVYYAGGEGGGKSEYTGGRKFDKLKEFVDKASAPPLQEIRPDELEDKVKDQPVVYLLLHSAADTQVLNSVTQASNVLIGNVPIYTLTSPTFFTRYSISTPYAIIALKDFDTTNPSAIYSSSLDVESISKWLLHNKVPTTTELSQETFQNVMNAPNRPLVVITAVNKGNRAKVEEKIKAVGKKWKLRNGVNNGGRDVVFTWMDGEKWSKWLGSMYSLKSGSGDDDTPVVIADHSKLIYYDTDASEQLIKLTSTSIFAALEGIEKGTVKPKSSENFAERMSRYLNEKIIGLETFIFNKPLQFIGIIVLIIGIVFLGLRRALAGEIEELKNGKGRRLD